MALSLERVAPFFAGGGLVTQQPWLCNGRAGRSAKILRERPLNAWRKPPIDNNPTPSYLSIDPGRF